MADGSTDNQQFQIFRGADAPGLMEAACMSIVPFTPVQREGMDGLMAAGYSKGEQVKVLINIPGFSLTHVWFKKDYPLPLHSHNADCLYYIIAGSLLLGNETLGPRDGFFIPSDVPYAYRPGPDGVELLEFRHANSFDFRNHANGAAFWKKGAEIVAANKDDWEKAKMPALNT